MEIAVELVKVLGIENDMELAAQAPGCDQIKQCLKNGITASTTNQIGRTLVHQCCIYGNLQGLKYLVEQWGVESLQVCDKFNTSCVHFAGL